MYILKLIIFCAFITLSNNVYSHNVIINKENYLLDTIYINKKDLIISINGNKSIYKNLISEGISVTTWVSRFKNNNFYLISEYNASSTKMQYIYKFNYSIDNKIILLYKEVVYLKNRKITGLRVYPNTIELKDLSIDKLENIGEKFNIDFNKIFLYDDKGRIAIIEYSNNGYERFIDVDQYLEEAKTLEIDILNVERVNNLAFNLLRNSCFDDSIFLLKNILKEYPTRVVAYLNIADAYWAIDSKELAIKNYKKYVALMQKQKKDLNKIPNYVYVRIN